MDVMEPTSVHDLYQGLSSNTLLDSNGFHDNDDQRDSLLDLLSQSFPDMLLQPFGHLSSLPLDAPDLHLSIQEDDDYQESDSADDSILQEFVCEVQNILSDTKRSNVSNAPNLGETLSCIAPLLSTSEDAFSPVKKLCPEQLDLLMGPLLDDDEEDFKPKVKEEPLPALPPAKPVSLLKPDIINHNKNSLNRDGAISKALEIKAVSAGRPAIACVKPLLENTTIAKPSVLNSNPDKPSVNKPAVASVKPIIQTLKVEEESSDEVDIETIDDDELNGRSGAEVLSAKLANMECQAARVQAHPPKVQPKSRQCVAPSPVQVEKCHKPAFDQSLPAKNLPTSPSFPPMVKQTPKQKEKVDPSPSSVVEKIKQSAVTPRSSILIPHQGPPQSRGKTVRQEAVRTTKSTTEENTSTTPFPYIARTLDHDYCNMGPTELSISSMTAQEIEQDLCVVSTGEFCIAEESIVLSDFEVPSIENEVCNQSEQSKPKTIELNAGCDVAVVASKAPKKETVLRSVKSERELPISYRKWHHSRSPSPYSQKSCKKRGSRRRSSCSPSSVSSQSIYRSRSRSSSNGRKGRSQPHHRRKHSRGRRVHKHHSTKRSRYTYSRSSSQSSYSSRSRSRSLSRSRSRTRSRSPSRSRSRSQSWDYKRSYNRTPVQSYGWAQEKRHFHEEKTQQIEERRVVYVGRLPDGTTKNDLRHRFGCFGPIQEVSVHFRDSGHNYGFVTFSYKRDAYEAVEHGNDDPNQPKFDLSFGGRRQFCRQRYADLDSQYSYSSQRSSPAKDFDSLLRAAKLKLKSY